MSPAKKTKRALGVKKNEETQTQILKLQIARLEEQVKLLTMENDHLRNRGDLEQSIVSTTLTTTNELESSNLNETPRSVRYSQRMHSIQPIESGNISTTLKVCGCKGKCATKACGCMKRNISCSKLCKCSSSVCQNQEKDDEEKNKENLENIEVVHAEANQIKNKNLINVAPHRSLFSPDTTITASTPKLEQCIFSPVQFGSPNLFKFDSEGGTSEQLNQTIEDQETKDNFDPMKPKNQLLRTPPTRGKRFVDSHTGSSSSIQTPDIMNKEQEELQVPEELNQTEVDWDKFQTQLIPCNKCNRKFHPRRIEKHQNCCKKV